MAQESEEKRLPASGKKLREARRKGKVPQSRDLVAGFTIFAALAYLFYAWPFISDRLFEVVRMVAAWDGNAFGETSKLAIRQVFVALFASVAPLAVIVAAMAVVFGMIATRGPVFALDPLKPQFEHINPANGFKRLVSLRNLVEFTKSLIKVLFLALLLAVILLAWLQPLFETPACGSSCIKPMILTIVAPLAIAAALAFILIGLLDVPIQRWLFLRDMRMTRTEYKREQKDLEGDPLIRQELRRQRHEAVARMVRLGIGHAVLTLVGDGRLIALRYVPGETPVPIIVAKEQGRAAAELLVTARELDCPIVEDAELVAAMFAKSRTGEYLDASLFSPVVRHLVRLRLV
jgi:type III secretion protein U